MLTPSAKLEFTAKLAQVEFGPRPELGLGGIITPSIGDQTPHGMADAQVLRGVLDWMSAHESEIAHLDRAEPLLPQLPLLTGESAARRLPQSGPAGAGEGSLMPRFFFGAGYFRVFQVVKLHQ